MGFLKLARLKIREIEEEKSPTPLTPFGLKTSFPAYRVFRWPGACPIFTLVRFGTR